MNLLKLTIAAFFTVLYFQPVIAQKLPDTQEASSWAAVPVKVDGKTDEGSAFKAYNKNTKLSYTLSNDARNLYLVIQSVDVNKILMGGITLTLNTSGKKKEKDAASFTYPNIVRQARGQGQRGQGGFGRMGGPGGQAVDSAALLERRKQQLAEAKEIKVLNIEGITDTLVSIYNEYGIKAAANVDLKGTYTYELAIPLSLLKVSTEKPKELAYSIQVNGRQLGENRILRMEGGGGREGGFGGGGFGGGNAGAPRGNFDPSMFEPTFFWGKYIPVKQ